ncbi:MAG TPA: phosphatase PAP2 family protein [Chitinophagaceae bacterium]|nr:phosphatase PAP2 family protein [Chitinophagaceae bacterium]
MFLQEKIKYPKIWFIFVIIWTILGAIAFYYEQNHSVYYWIQTKTVTYFPPKLIISLTHMGTFYFIAFLLLLFFFMYPKLRTRKSVYLLLLTQITPLTILQFLKYYINAPRPSTSYGEESWFNSIPEIWGHSQSYWLSFPSGHTEGISALFAFLVLLAPNKHKYYWAILGIILIPTVAYTRLYLSQHFLLDVWVGGMIGLWSGIAIYAFSLNSKSKKQNNLKINKE